MIDKLVTGGDPHLEAIRVEVVDNDVYGLRELHRRGLDVRRFVDIGASFGPASALIMDLWPQSEGVAYEPDTDRRALLHGLVADSPRIVLSVFPFALYGGAGKADRVGWGEPWRASPDVAWMQLLQLGDTSVAPVGSGGTVFDLLKIDCEGFEWGIIEALSEHRELPHVIVGEWHFDNALAGIRAALEPTHDFTFARPDTNPWGPFTAIRKGHLP